MHDLDIFPLESLILDNCVIIDKSKHWSLLLFKESLHIQRQKPELNHGSKASNLKNYAFLTNTDIMFHSYIYSVIPDDDCKFVETL